MTIILHDLSRSYRDNHDFEPVKQTKCLRYQLVLFLATTAFWTDVVFGQFFKQSIYSFVMNMTTHCAHVLLHGDLLIVFLYVQPML